MQVEKDFKKLVSKVKGKGTASSSSELTWRNSELIQFEFQNQIRTTVWPKWMQDFQTNCVKEGNNIEKIINFSKAIDSLDKTVRNYTALVPAKQQPQLRPVLLLNLKSTHFCTIPLELGVFIEYLCAICFAAFQKQNYSNGLDRTASFNTSNNESKNDSKSDPDCMETDESDFLSNICFSCQQELIADESCGCERLLEEFRDVCNKLSHMDLLDRIISPAALNIAEFGIERHVQKICKTDFESENRLESLMKWLEECVLGWLKVVGIGSQESVIQRNRQKLIYNLYLCLTKKLISQLFDIIVCYPESIPALTDLRACLERVHLRAKLLDKLKDEISTRLLHPGVSTTDILTVYISCIKALRLLDPSSIIMESVCKLIRGYLRQRTDTVRCIVSCLTDGADENSEFNLLEKSSLSAADQQGGGGLMEDSGSEDEVEDADEHISMSSWKTWMPDPVDGGDLKDGGGGGGRRGRRKDIMAMLVTIYGSKEIFIKEYAQLLAERILKNPTALEHDREESYIEQLKKRFGENELRQCEVMLKDLRDSRRVDSSIQSDLKEKKSKWKNVNLANYSVPMDATIISQHFWPQKGVKVERLKLPTEIEESMKVYEKIFSRHKQSRMLEWRPQLGLITIELALDEESFSLEVTTTPPRAALIHQFSIKNSWTIEKLAKALGTTSGMVRKSVNWWVQMGILKEWIASASSSQNDPVPSYSLVDKLPAFLPSTSQGGESGDEDEEEGGDGEGKDGGSGEEELQQYWSYMAGLLRNLKQLRAERIHHLLKMLSSPGRAPSIATVTSFLDKKVKAGLLVFVGGEYKLAPSK